MSAQSFLENMRKSAGMVSPVNRNMMIIDRVTFNFKAGDDSSVLRVEGVVSRSFDANPRVEVRSRASRQGAVRPSLEKVLATAREHGIGLDFTDPATAERIADIAQDVGLIGSALQGWMLPVPELANERLDKPASQETSVSDAQAVSPAEETKPAPKARRKIGEVRSVIDSLWWSINDFQGHMPTEFLMADVPDALGRKVVLVQDVLDEGISPRFQADLDQARSAIERAQEMIARWRHLTAEGAYPAEMGRGEAWTYLRHVRGVEAARVDEILATPSSSGEWKNEVRNLADGQPIPGRKLEGMPDSIAIPRYLRSELDAAAELAVQPVPAKATEAARVDVSSLQLRDLRRFLQGVDQADRIAVAGAILMEHPEWKATVTGLMSDVFQQPMTETSVLAGEPVGREGSVQVTETLQARPERVDNEAVASQDNEHAELPGFLGPQPVSVMDRVRVVQNSPENGLAVAEGLLLQLSAASENSWRLKIAPDREPVDSAARLVFLNEGGDRIEKLSADAISFSDLHQALAARGWNLGLEHNRTPARTSMLKKDEGQRPGQEYPSDASFSVPYEFDEKTGEAIFALYLLNEYGERVAPLFKVHAGNVDVSELDVLADELTAKAVLSPLSEPWAFGVLSMSPEDLRKFSPADIQTIYDVLEDANYASDCTALLAKRYGNGKLAREAVSIVREHNAAGSLSFELKERRHKVDQQVDPIARALSNADEVDAWFAKEIEDPLVEACKGNDLDSVLRFLARSARTTPELAQRAVNTVYVHHLPLFGKVSERIGAAADEGSANVFEIGGSGLKPVATVEQLTAVLLKKTSEHDSKLVAEPYPAAGAEKTHSDDPLVVNEVNRALDGLFDRLAQRLVDDMQRLHPFESAMRSLQRQLDPFRMGPALCYSLGRRAAQMVSSTGSAAGVAHAVGQMKAALVSELPAPFAGLPANWIVLNAPRPLLGEMRVENGEFVHGRFYVALDPAESMTPLFLEENRRLDAYALVIVPEEDVREEMAFALISDRVGDDHADRIYRALPDEDRIPILKDQLRGCFGESFQVIRGLADRGYQACAAQVREAQDDGWERARQRGVAREVFDVLAARRELIESFEGCLGSKVEGPLPFSLSAEAGQFLVRELEHINQTLGNVAVGEQLSRDDVVRAKLARPTLNQFSDDSPEFYRWYEHGGRPRREPLTATQLIEELVRLGRFASSDGVVREMHCTGCSPVSDDDWAWFKQAHPDEVAALHEAADRRASPAYPDLAV